MKSSSNRDAIEFCSIPLRASAHATCPCVKLRSSESTKGAEPCLCLARVPGVSLPRRFAPENSRLSAAELQPTQAIPGSQRPLFALGGLYPIFVARVGQLPCSKQATLFYQMKQKQSQNTQIIDRESRSLIPLQHSLIARLNSLLSRKNSLLGCLGNWPRKHLRSLTFPGNRSATE